MTPGNVEAQERSCVTFFQTLRAEAQPLLVFAAKSLSHLSAGCLSPLVGEADVIRAQTPSLASKPSAEQGPG